MKIEAYKCDYCKKIYEPETMTGVKNESDIFDKFSSFPTCEPDHKLAFAHFCFECYRVNVLLNVQNKMNWRDGEKYSEERELLKRTLIKEYSYIFRHETMRRYLAETGLKKVR